MAASCFSRTTLASGTKCGTCVSKCSRPLLIARRLNLAETSLHALEAFFPNSLRVKRLQGLRYEQLKEWDKARLVYDEILTEDPANMAAMKRKICILKAQKGQDAKAIEMLNVYLSTFMTDTDAWAELSDMYLKLQMYKNASFCYERN